VNKTRFSIPKMDCGAEEQLVRMALHRRPEVHRIEADVITHELVVLHEGSADAIAALLLPLNLCHSYSSLEKLNRVWPGQLPYI
jgi:cation transport ATPase